MNIAEEKKLIHKVIASIYKKAKNTTHFLKLCKSQRGYIHDKELLKYFDAIENKFYSKLTLNPKHFKQKAYKGRRSLAPLMTMQERHERNGMKGVEIGYSSTGVKLPTYEQKKQYSITQRSKLVQYYKSHPDEKRPSKMFINVSMGGHNKKY